MMWKFSFLLVLLTLFNHAISFDYEGYKVYEIIPKTRHEADILHEIETKSSEVDFWDLTKLPNHPARTMVSPQFQAEFENILNKNGLKYSVVENDISRSISKRRATTKLLRQLNKKVGFNDFHRFDEINSYLDELSQKYSSYVSVNVVGKSHENRVIKTIKITNGDNKPNKKVIFIDAGIHAREWIAPAEALYVIYQLVENRQNNENLLKDYDWIVLPVVNPDGYEYTHTDQRFWRKTRKMNKYCPGTDGNRNYGFHWGEVGTSSDECSDIYKGSSPFSEPETQIVRDILQSLKGQCKMYITLHSFGNYILYPWGWTSALPKTWKDLDEVGQAGAAAINKATGSRYSVGSSTNVLYAAAGGSDDYAYAMADVPIAFTMELPRGGSGFDPKPSQIKSMVEETWVGISAMAEKVIEKY